MLILEMTKRRKRILVASCEKRYNLAKCRLCCIKAAYRNQQSALVDQYQLNIIYCKNFTYHWDRVYIIQYVKKFGMFAKKITWKLRNEDLDHLYQVSSRRKSAFKLPLSIIDDHVILTDKIYDTMKLVRKDIDKNGSGYV